MGNHGGMLTGCTQLLFLSQLPFKNEIHVLSYTIFHLRVISYPTWFFGLRPRPFSLLTQVFQLVCENGNCTDLGSQILQEDFSCSLFINQDSQLTRVGLHRALQVLLTTSSFWRRLRHYWTKLEATVFVSNLNLKLDQSSIFSILFSLIPPPPLRPPCPRRGRGSGAPSTKQGWPPNRVDLLGLSPLDRPHLRTLLEDIAHHTLPPNVLSGSSPEVRTFAMFFPRKHCHVFGQIDGRRKGFIIHSWGRAY